MDRMCAILRELADWVGADPNPHLIYAAYSRVQSRNSPAPIIGIGYQVEGQFDWWDMGDTRTQLPNNHLRVGWAHRGGGSSNTKPGIAYWAIAFNVDGETRFDRFVNGPPIPTIPVRAGGRLCRAYQDVATQFLMRRRTSGLRLKAALLNWFAVLLDEAHGRESYADATLPRSVERALEYMHRQIARQDLSLREVAGAAGLSLHHFGRVFASAMRQTPMAYLRQVRIEHAKNLLRDTRLRVSEVAHESGFADPLHFSRVFRRYTGTSPRTFREARWPGGRRLVLEPRLQYKNQSRDR